jgi:(2Fe-2S) ferredoxin
MMKFYEEMESRGLFGQAIVTGSTCVGPCHLGTTVIVYPEGVWYQSVTPQNVPEIMEQHIKNGKPVERLVMPESVWAP